MNSEINYKKIRKYINICKKSQGEYIPGGHPMTSWATTYSDVFVEASARIYVYLRAVGLNPLEELSKIFIENEIKSCRGSLMTYSKVEYLYENHIKRIIKFSVGDKISCEFCKRIVGDAVLHVSQKHANEWDLFSIYNDGAVRFYLEDKKRCGGCGNFVLDLEVHGLKCIGGFKSEVQHPWIQ